ncbi:hypothetical protein ACFCW6_12660 [Streptomyces sp. NPDC056333]
MDRPGDALSARLPAIRDMAAELQGRSAGAPSGVGIPVTLQSLHQGSD